MYFFFLKILMRFWSFVSYLLFLAAFKYYYLPSLV